MKNYEYGEGYIEEQYLLEHDLNSAAYFLVINETLEAAIKRLEKMYKNIEREKDIDLEPPF